MSYSGFMNKTCTVKRYSIGATRNDAGEYPKTETVVGTGIPCRIEKEYDRGLTEQFTGGDHNKGLYVVFFEIGVNIRAGDLVTINGDVPDWQWLSDGENNEITVVDVDDAGGGEGHHIETLCQYRKGVE